MSEKPEDKTTEEANTTAAAVEAKVSDATQALRSFADKVKAQMSELGNQVGELSEKLSNELSTKAEQVRASLNNEIDELKKEHPETFAKIDQMKDAGEDGLTSLKGRLNKLAGDLEKGMGGLFASLTDSDKKHDEAAEKDAAPGAVDAKDDSAAPKSA